MPLNPFRFPFRYKEGRKQMLADMMNHPSYVRSRYVKKLPPNADRLIEHLLHPDEHMRGTVQTILSNPYLRSKVPNWASSSYKAFALFRNMV